MLLLSFYILFNYLSYSFINEIADEFRIIEVKDNRYLVKNKFIKLYLYSNNKYQIGDIIFIKGKIIEGDLPSYLGDYNEKLNYFSKNILGKIEVDEIRYIRSSFSFYNIRDNICKFYENKIASESFIYFKALTLGLNDLDNEVYAKLNLAHIIAISGFHIIIIYEAIRKICFYFSSNLYLSDIAAMAFVFIFTFICNFQISILKAFLYLLYKKLNIKEDIFTSLDILSLVFITLMIINPKIIFNIGFILGFISSFVSLFLIELINTKNIYIKEFLKCLLYTLFLFPFITLINNELSLISFISFIFFDIFTHLLIPYSFILYIIPSFSFYANDIIIIINNFLEILSNFLIIKIPTMTVMSFIIYYILLFLMFFKINYSIFYIINFLIYLFVPLTLGDIIVFIDVNQGDSTYLRLDGDNILIDCHNSYKYLIKNNIRTLDAIFITHDDYDHISDLELILDNILVDIIYVTQYAKESIIIANSYNIRISILEKGDIINYNDNKFSVISPKKDYEDDNANSMVLKLDTKYYSYLFAADINVTCEVDLLDELKEIDVLKVAHHGSNTSSSEEFLKAIRPKYSIISVGANNRYNLPSPEVLNRLKRYSKVYMTKDFGNITFKRDKILTYKKI